MAVKAGGIIVVGGPLGVPGRDGANGAPGRDGVSGAPGVVQSVNGKSAASITLTGDDITATVAGTTQTVTNHIAGRAARSEVGFLGVTRAGLSAFTVPAVMVAFTAIGHATAGDLGQGTPWVLDPSNGSGPLAKQDAGGRWWCIKCTDTVNVGWFGAKGDGTTDDSAAFQAALNSPATAVIVPPATFIVQNVTIPTNKSLIGHHPVLTGIHGPLGSHTYILRATGGNTLRGFNVNGRNLGQRGISITGSQNNFQDIRASNSIDGLYNEDGVYLRFTDVTTFQNSRAGLYSADGMNTCWLTRFWSLTGDAYGCFFTYTALTDGAAPCQGINMQGCFFFGNTTAAVWFERETFDFTFNAGAIDGQSGTGIRFGTGLGSGGNIYITNSFVGAGSGASIDVGGTYNNISINNCAIGNGYNGIIVRATTSTER